MRARECVLSALTHTSTPLLSHAYCRLRAAGATAVAMGPVMGPENGCTLVHALPRGGVSTCACVGVRARVRARGCNTHHGPHLMPACDREYVSTQRVGSSRGSRPRTSTHIATRPPPCAGAGVRAVSRHTRARTRARSLPPRSAAVDERGRAHEHAPPRPPPRGARTDTRTAPRPPPAPPRPRSYLPPPTPAATTQGGGAGRRRGARLSRCACEGVPVPPSLLPTPYTHIRRPTPSLSPRTPPLPPPPSPPPIRAACAWAGARAGPAASSGRRRGRARWGPAGSRREPRWRSSARGRGHGRPRSQT